MSAPARRDAHSGSREARLREEAAWRYPSLDAGKWLTAAAVAKQVLGAQLTDGTEPGARRLLDDEHFEFRGGLRHSWTDRGSRARREDRWSSRQMRGSVTPTCP